MRKEGCVALVDVDMTLILGASNIEPTSNIDETVLKLKDFINNELLNALKESDIKEIYLFTDMNFEMRSIKERHALIKILKERGFTVHGVITSSDCFWHLREDLDFINYRDKQGQEQQAALNKLLEKISSNNNKDDKKIAEPEVRLGRPFKDAEADFLNNRNLQEHINNSQAFTGLAYEKARKSGYTHRKALMFNHFLSYCKQKFSYIFVFDDLPAALDSVAQANNEAHNHQLTIPIFVHNDKPISDKTRTKQDYINDIESPIILINACSLYKKYLEDIIYAPEADPNEEDYILARKKLNIVCSMTELIPKTFTKNNLNKFKRYFLANRTTLEERRDSAGMIFLKIIATFFTLGMAMACGIWNVRGRETAKNIEIALSDFSL